MWGESSSAGAVRREREMKSEAVSARAARADHEKRSTALREATERLALILGGNPKLLADEGSLSKEVGNGKTQIRSLRRRH